MTSETVALYRRFSTDQAAGSSPLYEAITAAVADDQRILALLEDLPEPKRQPNLLLGAVRYLHGVPEGYDDFREWVLQDAERVVETMLNRSTQTNEPARCLALMPLLATIPGPLALIEVGASAGLCLYPDRYRYDYDGRSVGPVDSPVTLRCTTTGDVPVPRDVPAVRDRVGIDLNPLDVTDDDDRRWLECLVWPEHHERFDRLRAAAELVRSEPPRLVAGDLVERLPAVVAELGDSATVVVFHTAVMPYLPAEARAEFIDLVTSLPVRWISQEGAFFLRGEPARWPGGDRPRFVVALDGAPMALASPHGGEVDWL